MSAISLPAAPGQPGNLRPINVLHDLPAVADLIELCFHSTMDSEGRRTIDQIRSGAFLRWAPRMAEAASLPHSGFVWEQDGHIVGNISLIPFSHQGQRIYLIANVATHPDYRQRGIGRALTEQAMACARERNADAIWLQVRDDNPGAIHIYTSLGFSEQDRRTTWANQPETGIGTLEGGYSLTRRTAHFWPQQKAWLERLYPDSEAWYRRFKWDVLRPGLWNWLYRLVAEYEVRQWAVLKDERLQAVIAWTPWRGGSDPLWVALSPEAEEAALTFLLRYIRRELFHRRGLSVELPAGLAQNPLHAAGFNPLRTLIWMRAPGATK